MKTHPKIETEIGCGSASPNAEKSPHQEILEEQGEIFSCGGVYLANCYDPPPTARGVDYLHLPNRGQGVMVFKGGRLHRRTDVRGGEEIKGLADKSSSGETLRRFFKESLN
jgi:hypothetical protein